MPLWRSSNPDVATVSQTGEITCCGLGTAEIIAVINGGQFVKSIQIAVMEHAHEFKVDVIKAANCLDHENIEQYSCDCGYGFLYTRDISSGGPSFHVKYNAGTGLCDACGYRVNTDLP